MIKLIKNANIISHSTNGVYDVLIEDDKISKIDKNIDVDADEIIIAEGKTLIPGLIDMHVHFRQPGFDHRETLETGSLAALHGGVTTVGMMPNTKPALDNSIMIEYMQNKSKELDLINILPIGAITKGREGKELAGMRGMTDKGAIAFSDDGAPVYDPNIMYRAAQYSLMTKRPLINHAEVPELAKGNMREGETSCKIGVYGIPEIAESIMVARDIEISKYTGAHVHIAHVSTSQTVDLLKYSKMQNLKVTSEVTHNHLLLNEEACESYSTDTKINPPLPDKKSQKALIEAIRDNTINMIVSDHAPYAKYEKEVEFETAPTGISGVETLLSGIIKLSKEQKIELKDLIEKVTYNPANIFRLENIGDIKEGKSFDEIVEEISKVEKSKVLFSIPTLKFLKAGGRIGKVSGTIGEILNIKPVITCNFDGIYETVSKSRGMKKAIKSMFDKAMEFVNGDEVHSLAVYHSGDEPETLKLVEGLKKNLGDLMNKSLHFFEGKISPTMIVHTGNGLIGMAVIKK